MTDLERDLLFPSPFAKHPERADPAQDLTTQLRAFGKRQKRIYAGKIVAITCLLAAAGWAFSLRAILPGGLCMLAGLLLMVLLDWREVRPIATLDLSASSTAALIAALERRDDRFRNKLVYWVPFAFFCSGICFIQVGIQGYARVLSVILGGALPYAAGLRIRRARLDEQCRPLLDQIARARAALESELQERAR